MSVLEEKVLEVINNFNYNFNDIIRIRFLNYEKESNFFINILVFDIIKEISKTNDSLLGNNPFIIGEVKQILQEHYKLI